MVSSTLACEEGCSLLQPSPYSQAQPATRKFARAVHDSWCLLTPCRAVGPQPGWFHPSVPQGVYHRLGRHCPLPHLSQGHSLWPLGGSGFCSPGGQLPSSPRQQLSSQHCPVPDTWAPRCHLPPCFRQQVGELRTRARRKA